MARTRTKWDYIRITKSGFEVCKKDTKADEKLPILTIECFGISRVFEARKPLRKDYLEYIRDSTDGFEHDFQRKAEAQFLLKYDLALDQMIGLGITKKRELLQELLIVPSNKYIEILIKLIDPTGQCIQKMVQPYVAQAAMNTVQSTHNTINGYKVIGEIGAGGNGKVLLVTKDGKKCAMKQFLSQLNPQNEISKIKQMMNCPNIISYINDFVFDGRSFLVLEYMEHGDLLSLLDDKQFAQPVIEEIIVQVFQQMLLALVDLKTHGNIIHRDIKP